MAAWLANLVYYIYGGDVPLSWMVVFFVMLLNLVSVVGAMGKDGLWGFVCCYVLEAASETHSDLDQAAEFALCYFRDFVALTFVFCVPDGIECAVLEDLLVWFVEWDGGLDAEALQSMVFVVGKEYGFELLWAWFMAFYEVLLG